MSTSPLVVRVLTGRLGGAELPVPETGAMSIGHEYWNGLVIREADARGVALELERDEAGVAHLTVLSGGVGLLGSVLEVGRRAPLPPFVPFMVGSHWLAWGAADSTRWAEARALIEAPPAAAPAETADGRRGLLAAPMEFGGDLVVAARSWLTDRRAGMILGAGLLIAAAPVAGPTVRALVLPGDGVARTRVALGEVGLAGLSVAENPGEDADVVVTGVVSRDADRLKVRQVLSDHGLGGTVAVQTSQELAAAAADVARIQGISASARPIARTTVELRTEPLADGRRAALERSVRNDVSGLTRLVVRDDLPAADGDGGEPRTIDDVTKRVATVVAGDPAYVKTADGTYYFAGAMMPTGHRLVSIQGRDVLLEKDGRQVRLTF